jgi:hypothetical protein
MRTEGLDHLNISKDSIGNESGASTNCGTSERGRTWLADCVAISCYSHALLTLSGLSRSVKQPVVYYTYLFIINQSNTKYKNCQLHETATYSLLQAFTYSDLSIV